MIWYLGILYGEFLDGELPFRDKSGGGGGWRVGCWESSNKGRCRKRWRYREGEAAPDRDFHSPFILYPPLFLSLYIAFPCWNCLFVLSGSDSLVIDRAFTLQPTWTDWIPRRHFCSFVVQVAQSTFAESNRLSNFSSPTAGTRCFPSRPNHFTFLLISAHTLFLMKYASSSLFYANTHASNYSFCFVLFFLFLSFL